MIQTNDQICLFCGKHESGNIEPDKDIICGTCVTKLAGFTQEELYIGYTYAKKIGLHNKASAIESFLEKETIINGSKDNRLSDGSGDDGISQLEQKISAGQPKAKGKNAIRKGNSKVKNVFRSRRSKLAKR